MNVRPSVDNVSPRTTSPTANDGNSSAAQPAALVEQPIRGNRHELLSTAPKCVKEWVAGKVPTTAGAFNTCVGWLVRNHQEEGLQALLSSPQCSGFDKLDLSGKHLDIKALDLLALNLDRSSVTKLNLSGCQLQSKEHADAICVLLGKDSKLALLNLSHNKIGDMAPICNALWLNGPLKHLNLKNCGLNARNFHELLRVLCNVLEPDPEDFLPRVHKAKNQTLQTLCLADNELVNQNTDIGSIEDEVTTMWDGNDAGRMPSMRWLDLSNTGITLSDTLMLSIKQVRCPRMDLARNPFNDTMLMFLNFAGGITHLNLQGVSGTGLAALTLVGMPGLRVLDLRGAHPGLLETNKPIHPNRDFVWLRLDPEVAAGPAVKAIRGLTPLSSGDLLGPGAAFLGSWSPPGIFATMPAVDVSEGAFAKMLHEELDLNSVASLVSVNMALAGSRSDHLNEVLSATAGYFDWNEATLIAADPPDAHDVSEANALTTTASLTATTATATTTTTTDHTMIATTTTTETTETTGTTGTGAQGS